MRRCGCRPEGKKSALKSRTALEGRIPVADVVNKETGEVVAEALLPLTEAQAGTIASAELEYPIFVQGTAPRSALLRDFKATPHSVLLATSSFWQGVDVVGEALSCVVIDKLPFASPGDPITAARIVPTVSRIPCCSMTNFCTTSAAMAVTTTAARAASMILVPIFIGRRGANGGPARS